MTTPRPPKGAPPPPQRAEPGEVPTLIASRGVTAHPDEGVLLSFAEGGLEGLARTRVLEHVDRCSRCRQVVAELSRSSLSSGATEELEDDAAGEKAHVPRRRDPLVGERLGEYLVHEPMSRGGMGIVYRGEQPVIGKPVAIKVLLPHVAEDPEQVHRLLAEARAVNAIRHPNIVDIFGFGRLPDGRHYFVMELLEGEPLSLVVARRGRMRPVEVAVLLGQALGALDAAHAAGIIHRDLKPGNLFLTTLPDGTPRLKLLDFGIAKTAGLRTSTAPNTVLGTPGYMAPEQLRGETVTPQSDLFAIGVIAFRMLSGREPFSREGASLSDLIDATLHDPPPELGALAPEVPLSLRALVASMLEKEPEARPRSAAEVRKALGRIQRELTGLPPTVETPRPAPMHRPAPRESIPIGARTMRSLRPRRGPVAFAALLLVGLVVFAAVLAFPSSEAPRLSAVPAPRTAPAVEQVTAEPAPPPQQPPVDEVVTRPSPAPKPRQGMSRVDVQKRLSAARARAQTLPTAGIRRIVERELQLLEERLFSGEPPAQVAAEFDGLARTHGL